MHRPIITLTTDFGPDSPYVAAMKGVMLSICREALLVDLTHAVPPRDVRHAALVLAETTPWFPPRSIHVAVIDPGVGTDREILWAEIDERWYIAPDNGLLGVLARRRPPSRMAALTEREHWLPRVSSTFHGRDIMAPVSARLAGGLDPARLGPPRETLVQLAWPEVRVMPGTIQGAVERIDSFGNLLTDITAARLAEVPRDETTRVCCGEHETFGIFRTYADQPPMTFVALVGSSDRLELAIVGDSAAAMLGVAVGTPVTVRW